MTRKQPPLHEKGDFNDEGADPLCQKLHEAVIGHTQG